MHTRTNAWLSEDARVAVLDQGSARLWCVAVSPSEARFSVMDAKPLPSSPNPCGFFCYPYGRFNSEIVEIVEQIGFF